MHRCRRHLGCARTGKRPWPEGGSHKHAWKLKQFCGKKEWHDGGLGGEGLAAKECFVKHYLQSFLNSVEEFATLHAFDTPEENDLAALVS